MEDVKMRDVNDAASQGSDASGPTLDGRPLQEIADMFASAPRTVPAIFYKLQQPHLQGLCKMGRIPVKAQNPDKNPVIKDLRAALLFHTYQQPPQTITSQLRQRVFDISGMPKAELIKEWQSLTGETASKQFIQDTTMNLFLQKILDIVVLKARKIKTPVPRKPQTVSTNLLTSDLSGLNLDAPLTPTRPAKAGAPEPALVDQQDRAAAFQNLASGESSTSQAGKVVDRNPFGTARKQDSFSWDNNLPRLPPSTPDLDMEDSASDGSSCRLVDPFSKEEAVELEADTPSDAMSPFKPHTTNVRPETSKAGKASAGGHDLDKLVDLSPAPVATSRPSNQKTTHLNNTFFSTTADGPDDFLRLQRSIHAIQAYSRTALELVATMPQSASQTSHTHAHRSNFDDSKLYVVLNDIVDAQARLANAQKDNRMKIADAQSHWEHTKLEADQAKQASDASLSKMEGAYNALIQATLKLQECHKQFAKDAKANSAAQDRKAAAADAVLHLHTELEDNEAHTNNTLQHIETMVKECMSSGGGSGNDDDLYGL